ncbi:MAG: hypothetical protein FJY75_07810 [Candidatus Eisenbacteria bacterium]|uniref:Uncharacterized protein n=1 Tax=Eiseniibacteriota bacterium TaxID=2212470 RepID=A0A938BM76_UNCEI|nr:hypothetical protein [Candidatus Eisenbacteria bacterium]
MRRIVLLALPFCWLVGLMPGHGDGDRSGSAPVSSLSYPGHAEEPDTDILVSVYPRLVGTRLDDCQTCHAGGTVTYDKGGTADLYSCTYCHLLPHPDARVVAGAPADYDATLNPFGKAYKSAGRSAHALRAIAGIDSDGDTYSNAAELDALRYPGDPASRPGQQIAPSRLISAERIEALDRHSQFLLLNSKKQKFDTYAAYRGVTVRTLLESVDADLSAATSVSFIAPDGFAWDCPVAWIESPFPLGRYYPGLDPGGFADPEQGFVKYPPADQIPAGLAEGAEIPGDPWMLIAYGRDGGALDASYLDAASGRIEGEGPYRLIVPQATPGRPDRGSAHSPSGYDDGHDFDDATDHNAGFCVRGLVAVRLNPIPAGYEELDWKNGGWAMIAKSQLLVYGAGVRGD